MKAISLWQPWASLVALGAKKFETRSWATSYRGPLLIHAAMRWTMEERQLFLDPSPIGKLFRDAICPVYRIPKAMPFGCYVALVDLVEIFPVAKISDSLSRQELAFGNYSAGRFAWQLENIRKLEPIPARGQQGLWNPLKGIDATMRRTIESLYPKG